MSLLDDVDPGLRRAYEQLPERPPGPLPTEAARSFYSQAMAAFNAQPNPEVARRDAAAPGPLDTTDVPLRVYEPRERPDLLPVVLQIHGGAFTLGTLDDYDFVCERLVIEQQAVVVSVGYRLAPEHVFPDQLEDCYAALRWIHESAEQLGVDPGRMVVTGESAGACLAAGLALMARDRREFAIGFQLLNCPALDDRMVTPSSQLTDRRVVDRDATLEAWRSYLGHEPGGQATSIYAAPGRAEDLAGLPPTFIGVGQLDPMRDECIAYANRLMQAGVPTELHVWPGAYHGFEIALGAPIAQDAKEARVRAWRRALMPRTD